MGFAHGLIYEFVTLFVVLDPVATVPVFLKVTEGLSRQRAILVAFYAIFVSFLVLLFFIAGGQFLLEALKIPMPAFQLAGSIVLLLFGLKLVLGNLSKEIAELPANATLLQRAVYPLAIPGIAGAGAMLTVVLLTDNNTRSIAEQVRTTMILIVCLGLMFVQFALSRLLYRILGPSGVEIVSRVFGLIVASIAVNGLIVSIKLSFGLT
jgi:multiple antibiotic resistance protein